MGGEGDRRGAPLALLLGALALGGGAVWVLSQPTGAPLPAGPRGALPHASQGAAPPTTRALTGAVATPDQPVARLDPAGPAPLGPDQAPGATPDGSAHPDPAGAASGGIAGGATLIGRVVDRAGRPVAGAAVTLSGVRRDAPTAISVVKDGDGPPRLVRAGERRVGPQETDDQGRYRFQGVAPEVRWEIAVTPPPGLLPAAIEAPTLNEGGLAQAPDLVVSRPGSLAGVVLDAGGAPAAGARVLLGRLEGPMAALMLDMGEAPPSAPAAKAEPGHPPEGGPAGGGRVVRRAEKGMMFTIGGGGAAGLGGPAPLEARVDEQGRFSFAAVPPGQHTLQAFRRGERPAREELELAEGERREGVTLRLAPGLSLALRVVDPAGRPVEGARVLLIGRGPGGARSTDAEGRLELAGVEQPELTLSIEAQGFVPLHTTVRVPEEPEAPPVELVLRRGATLVGTVLRKSDGSPVDEGFVLAEPLVHDGSMNLIMGGDDGRVREGRFRLSGVAPGRYRLRVMSQRLAEATREVEVAPGTELLDVGQLTLGELGAIAVTVLDPDGNPAEGAEVQLGLRILGGGGGAMTVVRAVHVESETEDEDEDADGADEPPAFRGLGHSARTDAAGKARLQAVQPGKASVQAVKDGFAPAYSEELVVPEDGSVVETTLRLARGARVVGRVRGPAGAAQPGAQVLLLRQGQPVPSGQVAADDQGAFAFERVAPGRYRLALASGRMPGASEAPPEWFEVADGATVTRELAATPRARLEGTVRDAAGAPLAGVRAMAGPLLPAGLGGQGARVGFAEAEAQTDAAGRFVLEGLSAGRERGITLSPPEGPPETFRLDLPEQGTLRRDYQLGGSAGQATLVARVGAPEGRPAAGEPVTLESLDPERPLVRREVATGADGAARFEGLAPGRYAVSAGAAPWARARAEVTLTPAGAEAPLLQLVQGGTLAVELPAGAWTQAAIEVQAPGEPARMTSGGPGTVARLGGLTPGREYSVTVRAEGCAPFQAPVRAQAGEVRLSAVLAPR